DVAKDETADVSAASAAIRAARRCIRLPTTPPGPFLKKSGPNRPKNRALPSQTALPARHRARDLPGDIGLGAAEAIRVRRRDVHGDGRRRCTAVERDA